VVIHRLFSLHSFNQHTQRSHWISYKFDMSLVKITAVSGQ
jgi:competence transcription factor ComK